MQKQEFPFVPAIGMPSSPACVVCLGDSITYGDTGLGYRASRPWPNIVSNLLSVKVLGYGHNGASTVDYRTYPEWEEACKILPEADVIVVGLGTNDVDLEHARDVSSVAEVVTRFESFMEDVLGRAKNAPEVAVLSVLEFAEEEPIFRERFTLEEIQEINHGINLLNQAYRIMCRRNAWHYIDYASAVNQHRGLYGNSIHPNQRGYEVMAGLLAPRIAHLLGAC